jgi:hypothetical protein
MTRPLRAAAGFGRRAHRPTIMAATGRHLMAVRVSVSLGRVGCDSGPPVALRIAPLYRLTPPRPGGTRRRPGDDVLRAGLAPVAAEQSKRPRRACNRIATERPITLRY